MRGVARIQADGPACVLALSEGLEIGGNTVVNMPGCVLASNSLASDSIDVHSSPTITAAGLAAAGGCDGCDGYGVPYREYALPATNPYTWVDGVAFPPLTGGAVAGCSARPTNRQLANTWRPAAMCSGAGFPAYYVFDQNLTINSSEAVDLAPGTYFFYGTDLSVDATGSLTCSTCAFGGAGVTLVFAARNGNVGTITLNGTGTVALNAPNDGPYRGMLMYRDDAEALGGARDVTINGGNATHLAGGLVPGVY